MTLPENLTSYTRHHTANIDYQTCDRCEIGREWKWNGPRNPLKGNQIGWMCVCVCVCLFSPLEIIPFLIPCLWAKRPWAKRPWRKWLPRGMGLDTKAAPCWHQLFGLIVLFFCLRSLQLCSQGLGGSQHLEGPTRWMCFFSGCPLNPAKTGSERSRPSLVLSLWFPLRS